MIDENKEYTPADVLTVDDALSLAVMGYKVRASDMQEGAFIDYNFAGWRIHFPGGASSGWSQRSHDATVDWHVIEDEHVNAYKRVIMERDGIVERDQAEAKAKWGQGFAPKPAPAAPPVGDVLVMGDGGKWGSATPTAPAAPDNVGKWGKAVVPKKDSWGRPLT